MKSRVCREPLRSRRTTLRSRLRLSAVTPRGEAPCQNGLPNLLFSSRERASKCSRSRNAAKTRMSSKLIPMLVTGQPLCKLCTVSTAIAPSLWRMARRSSTGSILVARSVARDRCRQRALTSPSATSMTGSFSLWATVLQKDLTSRGEYPRLFPI